MQVNGGLEFLIVFPIVNICEGNSYHWHHKDNRRIRWIRWSRYNIFTIIILKRSCSCYACGCSWLCGRGRFCSSCSPIERLFAYARGVFFEYPALSEQHGDLEENRYFFLGSKGDVQRLALCLIPFFVDSYAAYASLRYTYSR